MVTASPISTNTRSVAIPVVSTPSRTATRWKRSFEVIDGEFVQPPSAATGS